MYKKTILPVCICMLILLVAGITLFAVLGHGTGDDSTPASANDNAINWQMHGYFVSADGTSEPLDISIQGILHRQENTVDKLENLVISYPDQFAYGGHQLTGSEPVPNLKQEVDLFPNNPDLFYSPSTAYHKQTETMSKEDWSICFDKGFYISLFENEPECYLVASNDKNISPEEIVEYFADFIEWFRVRYWEDT